MVLFLVRVSQSKPGDCTFGADRGQSDHVIIRWYEEKYDVGGGGQKFQPVLPDLQADSDNADRHRNAHAAIVQRDALRFLAARIDAWVE